MTTTTTPSTIAREAAEKILNSGIHDMVTSYHIAVVEEALRAAVAQAEAERDEARAELLAALKEAREDIDHWGSYAGDYFQEKWHFADTIRGYDERIAALAPSATKGDSHV